MHDDRPNNIQKDDDARIKQTIRAFYFRLVFSVDVVVGERAKTFRN